MIRKLAKRKDRFA